MKRVRRSKSSELKIQLAWPRLELTHERRAPQASTAQLLSVQHYSHLRCPCACLRLNKCVYMLVRVSVSSKGSLSWLLAFEAKTPKRQGSEFKTTWPATLYPLELQALPED
eukprot:1500187-Rhodomonas_salina.1